MRLLIAVLALDALLAPRVASACWDGYTGTGRRVSLCVMGGSTTWTPETARELADWLVRIDALVPAGYRVEACDKAINVCRARPEGGFEGPDCLGCADWPRQTMRSLFRTVAWIVGARPAAVRAARRLTATPYTVQIAAGRDERAARAAARRLDQVRTVDHGFYEAGGFPADNPIAHVVAEETPAGTVYRVWVGAYLTRAEAKAALANVRAATGMRGFVRAL